MSRAPRLTAVLAGALASALILAPALPAQATTTHRLAGPEVAVYNLVGRIEVLPGPGESVVVEVTRTGRDADRLSIDTDPIGGVPALRVNYPADQIIYPAMGRRSRSTFRIRRDGTWGDSPGRPWNAGREGREITVRGEGSGLEAAADLRILVPAGQRAAIHVGMGQIDARNVAGTLSLDALSGAVRVTGGSGSLRIDTGAGDIAVTGTTGDLDLDTGSGDVTVQRARGGQLRIDTGSGSVTGSDLSFDTANVDTGSGGIALDGLTGARAELETGSGDIDLRLTLNPDHLDVTTGSGSVRVRAPEALSATLTLESGSGELHVDFPLQLVRRDEDRLTGRIGDGKGRIRIETGSGDITVSR